MSLITLFLQADGPHCHKKWLNLLRSYKSCKDNQKKSGRGPTRFNFYVIMDAFLGKEPSNSSPHSINVLSLKCTEMTSKNAGNSSCSATVTSACNISGK